MCVYIYIYIYMYRYTHTYIYIYIYIYIYTYMHIYRYTHMYMRVPHGGVRPAGGLGLGGAAPHAELADASEGTKGGVS